MTKLEIRDYLEQIYKLDVEKVNTVNWDGEIKSGYKGYKYRTSSYKVAIVTLQTPSMSVEEWEEQKRIEKEEKEKEKKNE